MNKDSFLKQIGQFRANAKGKVPKIKQSYGLLKRITELLFPILSKRDAFDIPEEFEFISKQTELLLVSINFNKEEAESICNKFINEFENIYKLLLKDAEAIYNGDPAAESIEEVIVSYPGFYAICVYRISHELYKLNIPILPRLFSEYAHKKTGIDIHAGAKIEESFCIDHGTGIVIGETTIIGKHVKIYQGVTLGALSVTKDKAGKNVTLVLKIMLLFMPGQLF
jgi:serine O-acetyltransferase